MTISALHLDGLSKSFGAKTVLFPFELEIKPGEIHALLGQNGSGKSTLIKILSGFHPPAPGGTCQVAGEELELGSPEAAHRSGLRFVHQDLGLVASSTVLDNMSFGSGFPTRFGTIRRAHAEQSCRRALKAAGLALEPAAPVSALTPAQRTGVAVARALRVSGPQDRAVVLVLDEPTATLPTEEVENLHAMLRSAAATGIGILYVTHHLDEVYRLADRVSVLRDGHLVLSATVPDVDRDELVHHLIGGVLEGVRRDIKESQQSTADDRILLSVGELSTASIVRADLRAAAGEIVGIHGLTGSGRESILAAVFGAIPRQSGTVQVAGRSVEPRPHSSIAAGVGYLPPDRKAGGGFMTLDAETNLTIAALKPFWRRGWLSRRAAGAEAAHWFGQLQVRPVDGIRKPLASFSGGNQQKVLLGKWLRLAPRVLLLDEPTQGVDVGAKAELHRQIIKVAESGAAVVVSSTDVEELATLCDRVLIMRDGVIAAELAGDDVTETRINTDTHAVSTRNEGP
jgi:ribose transport system ATP-binding protein